MIPSIGEQPWISFAGVSQNYLVVYLSQDLSEDTSASIFGASGPLERGYHLIAVREASPQEREQAESCFEEAAKSAAERYNDAHGTAYLPEELQTETCTPDGCNDEAHAEFDEMFAREALNLQCRRNEEVWTPVEDPEEESISIRLGRSVPAALAL